MKTGKRLSQLLNSSETLSINRDSRLILLSDCHRGDGSWKDDFAHNQQVYYHALEYYYDKGFSYLELGDGDEMWELSRFRDIKAEYPHVYELLARFNADGRLHVLWGNHDDFKKKKHAPVKHFASYFHEPSRKQKTLMPSIGFKESLILRYEEHETPILLVHGHQGDFINDQAAALGKFLVRNLWGNLQAAGIKDPTSSAVNIEKKNKVERRLLTWTAENKVILIAGHTHRAMFPAPGEIRYFNTGSCVHPRCITGIEIDKGSIALIKWHVAVNPDGCLYIRKTVLDGPQPLDSYLRYTAFL